MRLSEYSISLNTRQTRLASIGLYRWNGDTKIILFVLDRLSTPPPGSVLCFFISPLDFSITSGKLWLKMRRMNVISPVLHIFVSSLRLKHRMGMIQRALDSPGLVDYFSYPHHGWKVRKKVFRAIWRQKFASKMRKVRNFEIVKSAWKRDFSTAIFFRKFLKFLQLVILHSCFHSDVSS